MASFESLIARNKRNTVILVVVVTAVLCVLGCAIGLVVVGWSNASAEAEPGYYYQPPDFTHTLAISALASLAVAGIMALFSYFGGASTLMAISNAREIQKSDDPQLFNIIEELSIAAGLPMPRIFVINDTALNAFATGRDPKHAMVAITAGLREKLNRDELQGVMAHELSHVRNYDIRVTMLMAVFAGAIVLLADFFMRYLWWGGGSRRRSDRDGGGGGLQVILLVVAIVLAILAPLVARVIQLAVSRQREYLADAAGAELTRYPEGLASALAKLESDQEPLEAANRATASLYIVNPFKQGETRFKVSSLFQTHPDIQDRIARLMSIGKVQSSQEK